MPRIRRPRWPVLIAIVLLAAALLPALPVLALRWLPPPGSAVIWQERLTGDAVVRQEWVPLEQVSRTLQLAVIAAEDQLFDQHWGFDLASIQQALQDRAEGDRLRGASTLSQQVAKNLFLWQGRSWLRKGMEAYLTAWIELLWPKRRILEVYVNIAQFAPQDYGAAAASRTLFGVAPSRLTRRQAALMAASLPNPRRLHADAPSDYLWQRSDWVLTQMDQLGYAYLDRL